MIALIPCSAPAGALEQAPLSALVGLMRAGEQWLGYWGSDDAYYARCVSADFGLTRWYRLGVADDETPRLQAPPKHVVVRRATPRPAARTPLLMVGRAGRAGRFSIVAVPHRR